jgi:hypothetical protein
MARQLTGGGSVREERVVSAGGGNPETPSRALLSVRVEHPARITRVEDVASVGDGLSPVWSLSRGIESATEWTEGIATGIVSVVSLPAMPWAHWAASVGIATLLLPKTSLRGVYSAGFARVRLVTPSNTYEARLEAGFLQTGVMWFAYEDAKSGDTSPLSSVSLREGTDGATVVPSSRWNIDKLDGRGPSRLDLLKIMSESEWTLLQVVVCLEPNSLRGRIGLYVNDTMCWVHRFTAVPDPTVPYQLHAIHRAEATGVLTGLTSRLVHAAVLTDRPMALSVSRPASIATSTTMALAGDGVTRSPLWISVTASTLPVAVVASSVSVTHPGTAGVVLVQIALNGVLGTPSATGTLNTAVAWNTGSTVSDIGTVIASFHLGPGQTRELDLTGKLRPLFRRAVPTVNDDGDRLIVAGTTVGTTASALVAAIDLRLFI